MSIGRHEPRCERFNRGLGYATTFGSKRTGEIFDHRLAAGLERNGRDVET